MFIGFPTLNGADPPPGASLPPPGSPSPSSTDAELRAVQSAMEAAQRHMARYDGSITQFRCDEKGFLMVT